MTLFIARLTIRLNTKSRYLRTARSEMQEITKYASPCSSRNLKKETSISMILLLKETI